MYTNVSTARHALQLSLPALLLTIGSPRVTRAQQPPTRLPGMVVTATPMPGPKIMTGVVLDTTGTPIPGAEIIIPGVSKRLYSDANGVFRFDGVPRGKHTMRARKLGYAPQIREFAVGDSGGVAEFELVPMARALPAVVSSVDRPGISGIVGDTAFDPLVASSIRVVGAGLHTETDSLGKFYLAARGGSHMVRIGKEGYLDKLVSVTYPADSGRRITVWLQPKTADTPVREAHNLDDLQERLAWQKPQRRLIYTHEQLEKFGSEWVYDAVASAASRFNQREPYSRDCMVMVNGGPSIANLSHLTIDEVETVEIYGAPSVPRLPSARPGPRGATGAGMTNNDRAAIENGSRNCPTVYVWLR
jgi:hypothetical protein